MDNLGTRYNFADVQNFIIYSNTKFSFYVYWIYNSIIIQKCLLSGIYHDKLEIPDVMTERV